MTNLNIISYNDGISIIDTFNDNAQKIIQQKIPPHQIPDTTVASLKKDISQIAMMLHSIMKHLPNHQKVHIETISASFTYGTVIECDNITIDGKYVDETSTSDEFITYQDGLDETKALNRLVELLSMLCTSLTPIHFMIDITQKDFEIHYTEMTT